MVPNGTASGVHAIDGLRQLHARRSGPVDAAALCQALREPAWLGHPIGSPPDRPDLTRVEADLVFPLRAGTSALTFHKAAWIDLGLALSADGCVGDISWRAATWTPLFPVFAGRLSVTRHGLELDGWYQPPAGFAGLAVDRAILHFVAQRTAEWFLLGIAAAMASTHRRGA